MRLPPFGGDGCWVRLIDISLGDDAHRRAGPAASSARSWPAIDSHAAGASSVRRPERRICRWSSPTLPTATGKPGPAHLPAAARRSRVSPLPGPGRFRPDYARAPAGPRSAVLLTRSRPGTAGQNMDGALPASLIVLPHQITADVDVDAYRSLAVGDLLRGAPAGLPSGETVTAALGWRRSPPKRSVPAGPRGPHVVLHAQGSRSPRRLGISSARSAAASSPRCLSDCCAPMVHRISPRRNRSSAAGLLRRLLNLGARRVMRWWRRRPGGQLAPGPGTRRRWPRPGRRRARSR